MLELLNKKYIKTNNIQIGLTSEQAQDRLKADGLNTLAKEKKSRPVIIFFSQFKDIMVIILLISTAISVVLGEVYDAVTIILIVLLNAILGFIQEYRTEKTLEALSKMAAPTSRCYRDGVLKSIPSEELVLDDVIELEAGDKVPADSLILTSRGLFADEAILTGETVPAEKASSSGIHDNSPGQRDVAYSGTIITKGHARAKVIATGINSQMGKISGMLSEIEDEETPLQKRLGELGKIVAVICIAVCVVVFLAGILRGEPVFDMLMTGISIAIAAIPEGLPATVTIALALAVSRMLKQNALVDKLHSVETLGCTSVICTDKTGTITENRMTVTKIYTDSNIFDVLGSGYRISGEIQLNQNRINPISYPSLKEILISGVLCNNGTITSPENINSRDRGKITAAGEWSVQGDPTELSLLVAAAKGGITSESLNYDFTKLDEIPFDSETRCMTVFVKTKSGEKIAYAKGAIDVILNKCSYYRSGSKTLPINSMMRAEIARVHDSFTSDALRVLAFAEKNAESGGQCEMGMTFLGLMGMLDPPRAEAKRAVKICSKAHIKTVMITGDHKNTAVAIAKQAGIIKGSADGKVMTGEELSKTDDSRLKDIIENISVFARVSPSDKLRIVRAFKAKNHIVTMTGDGVNDAPAVKEAHIGVSMGITGTDVTKQAADVILLDDNFATLVKAVEQGRTIYANIRKFVRYLLSCNIGEVITMFLGIIMGLPLVLLPTQILIVNLVTDGLPAVALSVEPVDESFMRKKPRSPDESFFSDGLMGKIVFRGIMIGLCTLGCFVMLLNKFGSLEIARTGALFTLILSQLVHVFECKSETGNIFTVPYLSNPKLILAVLASAAIMLAAIYFPPLQLVFGTVPLSGIQVLIASGFSLAIPLVVSIFTGRKKD
ncbi:MAG TPA: cation-translocating P-type ATPase [Oscillospiraceae bacterium]|nr:cation-translocating P-type ATPase [Oscillospiraceae bacterium]